MAFDPTQPLPTSSPRFLTRFLGWARGLFAEPERLLPEEDLATSKNVDPLLVPRAKMTNEDIDVGTLAGLSGVGLRNGKQISAESHPELYAAWSAMSARAGLPRPPQLILCESDIVNAMTLPTGEVAVTTGLFKLLTLRETVAVLGHELSHDRHVKTEVAHRLGNEALFTGAGAIVGNEVGVLWDNHAMKHPSRWIPWRQRPGLLGQAGAIFGLGYVGNIVANKIAVRPDELKADLDSVSISGDPEGLISALNKLEAAHSKPQGFWKQTAHFRSGYPEVSERIGQLRGAMTQHVPPPVLQSKAADEPGMTVTTERVYYAPEASTERVH